MNEMGALAFIGMCAAAAFALKAVVDAISRYMIARYERPSNSDAAALVTRLDQLATAVDAIAIEQERQRELQRFSTQLALDGFRPIQAPRDVVDPGATSVARPITPH